MADLMTNYGIFFDSLKTSLPGLTSIMATDALMSLPFMILIAGFTIGILARIFAIR